MILDESLEFCDATSLSTAATGLALIGDVIDTGAGVDSQNIGKRNLGEASEPLYLVIQVDTAVESSSTASVEFQLVSDAQEAIAVDGGATVHVKTASIAKATLVAGYLVAAIELPRGTYERYLGILQNVTTTALTAGKVNAFLTDNPGQWKSYYQSANI